MRRALILVTALAVSGCGDGHDGVATPLDDEMPLLAALTGDGVRASLVTADGSSLVLRVESPAAALGSVQGVIRFDPADFEVLESRPLTEAYSVVNAAEAGSGTLRFAAFAADGLSGGDLVSLRVRSLRPLVRAELSVQLEVAGTVEGDPLPADRLLATTRIYRVAP